MTKQPNNQQSDQMRQAGGATGSRQEQQFDADNGGRIAAQIHERMEVIGADGAKVGQVKRVEGNKLRLEGQDFHGDDVSDCSLSLNHVQSIEGNRVRLDLNAAKAIDTAERA